MRLIATEEHFVTPAFIDGPARDFRDAMLRQSFLGQRVLDALLDVGDRRIAAMDAAGIGAQVLSLNAPGVEQLDPAEAVAVAREANDALAGVVGTHPGRFYGLAAVATPDPEAAAAELAARVKQGFRGAIVNGHCRGRYLDDRFFSPFLECAAELDMPIYLHPAMPDKPVSDLLYSGFSSAVNFILAGPAWGFHIDTGLHVIRMNLGGVFDLHPNLQIVIGHLGEALPFMLRRLDVKLAPEATGLKRRIGDYLRENVHYTIADFNHTAAFGNLLAEIGAGRILFSTDYPYGDMAEGRVFLEGLALDTDQREKIAFRNAERLFRL